MPHTYSSIKFDHSMICGGVSEYFKSIQMIIYNVYFSYSRAPFKITY